MWTAFLIAAAAPTPEAEQLGRELASYGTLAALLPIARDKETADLLAEVKDLTPAQRERLKAVAARTFDAGRDRILAASGHAYAQRLSLDDLKALVAFHRTGAAQRAQVILPEVIAATMQAVGPMDFKADVRKAFCTETGKLCPKP